MSHGKKSSESPPAGFLHYSPYDPGEDPETAARKFHAVLKSRRSVRHFSNAPVSRETIEEIVAAAGTAPSGANKQPWRFIAIQDPSLKKEIRLAAEEEEREFYSNRASPRWLDDLEVLGTTADKEFLETAPWLIAVFKMARNDDSDKERNQVYYASESIGIACGMLLAAAHAAGLATLTHTPTPMGFLGRILRRPRYERPYLLIPIGHPKSDCLVPDVQRKPLKEILVIDRPAATE